MTPNRETRILLALLGLTILWAALALWYHRLWLEALSEATDELQHATLFLAARVKDSQASADRSYGAEAACDETPIVVSWPAQTGAPQDTGGDPHDGPA